MSNANRVAIAHFLEGAMALGRSQLDSLRMLTDDELTIVVNEFLKDNGTQHEIGLRYKHDDKIDAIKATRAVTDCSLLEAKNFVEGSNSLLVNTRQLAELRRRFGDAVVV